MRQENLRLSRLLRGWSEIRPTFSLPAAAVAMNPSHTLVVVHFQSQPH